MPKKHLTSYAPLTRLPKTARGVVPEFAMAHPDFGRSVNPILTRGDRLCPRNYYWHPRIFRPYDGPATGTPGSAIPDGNTKINIHTDSKTHQNISIFKNVISFRKQIKNLPSNR